ncbi:glycosyl hydrolase family 26 [Actinocorallia herbida]|uniref:Glycosyl hydrolase family 26 n=1 Tax=Actinocorallia herbida TaxID=58109 RepID=A0A3N1CQQ9_9ACTN|nr:glycosyl hydrolase [Actinocorallia herbida]ROO83667.1 glycosyl hydrolase family 26 [Actinocorallia herbida]
MTTLRPLLALTLPVVFAAGCASPTTETAAPKDKPTYAIDRDASGRDVYTEETPEAKSPAASGGSNDSAGSSAEDPAVDLGLDEADGTDGADRKAKKKVYNYNPPKNFKRYNAPGVVNVNKHIYPKRDIFGVFTDQARNQIADRNALAKKVGMKPNMIKSFYNWGNPVDPNWARSIWNAGAYPQLELEAQDPAVASVASVAAGQEDEYIRALAQSIKTANVPIVFSPFHEMNGDWYPWGHCGPTSKPESNACQVGTTPAQFRAAWKRMHNIFKQVGATNAIWVWQTNQIGARPQVRLKQFYPGNAYVDWAGTVGYYYPEKGWYASWNEIFAPTLKEIKKVTNKPIFIPEMGMEPSKKYRARDVKNFLKAVSARRDVIGFLWFNYNKPTETDFRIEASAASLKAFKYWIKQGTYGFDPRKVK